MKNLILTLIAISAFSITVSGKDNNPNAIVKSKYADVKIFAQPSSSSMILLTLDADQEVNFIRKSVANGGGWSIVFHDGRPGYVLSQELYEFLPARQVAKSKKDKKGGFLSLKKDM